MAKKSSGKKGGKYTSFKLHGSYPKQKVLIYIVLDFAISVVLGILIQPYIVNTLASTVAGN